MIITLLCHDKDSLLRVREDADQHQRIVYSRITIVTLNVQGHMSGTAVAEAIM